eukprot:scaffold52108_cov57-Phaeocystis_antarctica.AAC.5
MGRTPWSVVKQNEGVGGMSPHNGVRCSSSAAGSQPGTVCSSNKTKNATATPSAATSRSSPSDLTVRTSLRSGALHGAGITSPTRTSDAGGLAAERAVRPPKGRIWPPAPARLVPVAGSFRDARFRRPAVTVLGALIYALTPHARPCNDSQTVVPLQVGSSLLLNNSQLGLTNGGRQEVGCSRWFVYLRLGRAYSGTGLTPRTVMSLLSFFLGIVYEERGNRTRNETKKDTTGTTGRQTDRASRRTLPFDYYSPFCTINF